MLLFRSGGFFLDETLTYLLAEVGNDEVAEAHLLLQDVLNRQTPAQVLLESAGGDDLPDLSRALLQVMQRLNQLLHLELSRFINFIRQNPDRPEMMIIIQGYLDHLTWRVTSTIHPVGLLLKFP